METLNIKSKNEWDIMESQMWLMKNSLYGGYHGDHDLNYWKNDLNNQNNKTVISKYSNWSI